MSKTTIRESVSPSTSQVPAEMEAFLEIASRWSLGTDEQITLLGGPGRSTFFKWKKEGGSLPPDTEERLSHLLAIWKSLRILFTIDERGEQWVRKPNLYFDGQSALDVMLRGRVADIYAVRQYLDAQRGG